MAKRGPKSGAELILQKACNVGVGERPEPPYELTDAQCDVWYFVVNTLPSDWFTDETLPLLSQYCRHVVESNRIASMIAMIDPSDEEFDLKDYDLLLKMQSKETRDIVTVATKMRLTQQSRYTTQAAGTASKNRATAKKPWQQ